MKEDYKEEARELATQKHGSFINISNDKWYDLMSDFHKHQLSETRYHPDTLELVEKPEPPEEPYLSDTECDVYIQWQVYLDRWNNALTLEQVFEKYKEMKTRIYRWLH